MTIKKHIQSLNEIFEVLQSVNCFTVAFLSCRGHHHKHRSLNQLENDCPFSR